MAFALVSDHGCIAQGPLPALLWKGGLRPWPVLSARSRTASNCNPNKPPFTGRLTGTLIACCRAPSTIPTAPGHGSQGPDECRFRRRAAQRRHHITHYPDWPSVAAPRRKARMYPKHNGMRKRRKMKKKRFYAGRTRLLLLVGFFGTLGIVAMLIAETHTRTIPLKAGIAIGSASVPLNPSMVSVIPNSFAIAKGPLNVKGPLKSTKKASSAFGSGAGSGSGDGPIMAGDSKVHCITLAFPDGVLKQSVITAAASLTGVTYNCLSAFSNTAETWADWETPWMFASASDGWDAWLAASPAHQVVIATALIPASVSNSDPLDWEQPCAAGDYNQYATRLAENLVSYGAGNIAIRLGAEANGDWEKDYVGTTSTEMTDWEKCFDNEVAAMRAVPGAHFLFVWNPNICIANIPLSKWYPGNPYVDIIGADSYDVDCDTGKTVSQEGWTAYSTDSASSGSQEPDFPSLANIEAFAVANGKPMSFPEFGLYDSKPDDAAYMADMMTMFKKHDFAFECYFNSNDNGIAPLGSVIPNATVAYSQAFK